MRQSWHPFRSSLSSSALRRLPGSVACYLGSNSGELRTLFRRGASLGFPSSPNLFIGIDVNSKILGKIPEQHSNTSHSTPRLSQLWTGNIFLAYTRSTAHPAPQTHPNPPLPLPVFPSSSLHPRSTQQPPQRPPQSQRCPPL